MIASFKSNPIILHWLRYSFYYFSVMTIQLKLTLAMMMLALVSFSQAPSIHTFTVKTVKGGVISLSKFYGKKVLIVNTASFCGYTPQFAGLELLYKNFKQYDFEIIGFPCNDFGAQEPYSDSTISVFCSSNYGVTFPMMSKISIAASDTSPVYKWLQRANLNGKQNATVNWNFNKFLINESGEWVRYLPSTVDPTDTAIVNWIAKPSSLTGIGKSSYLKDHVELFQPAGLEGKLLLRASGAMALPIQISIFGMDGKLIHTFSIAQIQSGNEGVILDCGFGKGLYAASVTSGEMRDTRRILIE